MRMNSHAHLIGGTPDSMIVGSCRRALEAAEIDFAQAARSSARPMAWQAIAVQLGVSEDMVRRAVDVAYVSPFAPPRPKRAHVASGPARRRGRRYSATLLRGSREHEALRLLLAGIGASSAIAQALGIGFPAASNACAGLMHKGLAVRVGRGLYAPTEAAHGPPPSQAGRPKGRTMVFYLTFDDPHDDGRVRPYTNVYCGECGCRGRKRGAPNVAAAKFVASGWIVGGHAYGHRCPKHAAMAAAA